MSAARRTFLRIVIGGFIANFLLFTAGALFHIFFIRPAHKNFQQAVHTLAALENRDASLRILAHEVGQRAGDIQRLEEAFLDPDDIISFVTLLETMAQNSNVSLIISAADINTEVPAAKKAQFTASVTGSLNNIMKFVTLVENMPYFSNILSFTLSSQGGRLAAQIQLSVHTL